MADCAEEDAFIESENKAQHLFQGLRNNDVSFNERLTGMHVSCCSCFNLKLVFCLQVETLCQLLGSSVLKSVSDKNATSGSYIVLVPDRIDDETFHIDYFPRLVTNQIISPQKNTNCR
jgi:hypothetical protein